MKIIIRAALMALNIAIGIPAVATAAETAATGSTPAPIQQDSTASWANG